MKIVSQKDLDIPADDMKDGQIAVITEWKCSPEYIGRIVQRYGFILITLGKDAGQAFPSFFKDCRDEAYRVRILGPGTVIEI